MAATVVYEGVGGGGDLFRGQKYFLLQRVPQRNHWINLLVANGGEVVPLENQADIIIGDHVRKDQPVGSISWTFIQSCIKSGRLVDVEDHRAGPATRTMRPVGSSQPARKGRTPFTAEDDRVLMKWCAKAERQGLSLKGNDLYQQLEAVNNRHTFQSWRDRWIKHVSTMPRPEDLADYVDENEDEDVEGNVEEAIEEPGPVRRNVTRVPRPSAQRPTPRPPTPPQATLRRPAQPARSRIETSPPEARSPNASPLVQRSTGGNVFSEEETQELINAYDDINNLDEDMVIDAWLSWASQFPNHTAQEWRNHFVKYVVPRMKADRKRKELKPPSRLASKPPHIIQTIPGPNASNPGKRQSLEVKDSQGSSGENFQTSIGEATDIDPSTIDEATFKSQVSFLAESFNLLVDFEPVICKRKIPLFRLWQVVESKELGGYYEVEGRGLWDRVARRLNFSDYKHPTAAEELRVCFNQGILADYADVKQEPEDDVSLTDSQQQAMANEQLYGTAARETEDMDIMDGDEGDDDLNQPQSTPRQPFNSPASKRSSESMRQGPATNKRQRVDKGKGKEREIPSTPEDVINGNHMPRPLIHSSPLKYTNAQLELGDNSDDDDDDDGRAEDDLYLRSSIFRRTLSSAIEPHVSPRIQEPETQDFTYSAGQHDEPKVFHDLTPSPERSSAKLPDRGEASDVATHGTAYSSNKNEESSTQSQTNSEAAAAIDARVDHYVSLGYPQDVVCDALEATTMNDTNASYVMESLLSGEGIPKETPGVWTWFDDRATEGRRDSAEWDRIVKKHGIKGVAARKKFLKDKKHALKRLGSS